MEDDGTADTRLEPELSSEDLHFLYETMVLNRELDDRLLRMQRQGRIGFYLTGLGEEATHIGSTFALEPTDWVFPAYRELGAALVRGFPLVEFVCQIFGNSGDITKGRQMPNHYASPSLRISSLSSPVGTQLPHAAGCAWAAKIKGEKTVAITYFGEGATSQGDFHVALNFSGVFKLPVIFFCRNNLWAISVPLSRQTASRDIAVKAQAYGIAGVRVDGNDVLAVYQVTREAARRARAGEGATLIEAITCRMGPHSSSDDPRLYREEKDLEEWRQKDPIARFQRYLRWKGIWDEAYEKNLREKIQIRIAEAISKGESFPPPPLESLFEDVYSTVPWHLEEQRLELLALRKEAKH
ncbi:MAG: pyruvate dehydrogenase (acetyl-transferring) E1 component subunit alpha [Armatimonadetes bacterium]|nr:pyruvate dehydrogenase (acetyl-transferring) E1 component subunit alpha [Armatimonadota bacterium]